MVGEMHRFGFKDWQIRGRSRSTRVYVNDYSLDNDAAIEYLIEKDCDLSVLDN